MRVTSAMAARLAAGLLAFALVATPFLFASSASAAQCGNTAAGFSTWKRQFAKEAAAHGIGRRGINALMATHYVTETIRADRSHHGFNMSLPQFMKVRGAAAIVARGRRLKRQYARLFASIQRRYGVPPGPLIAIWGMETGFGHFTGNQPTISAVATLAYDCRRQAYFTDQLYAALTLVDRGELSSATRGARQGEVGDTQFLPKNILLYGVDGNGDGRINLDTPADALASTANYLKAHGWIRGAGYQPGQPNFAAIQSWNAATVYEHAIAIIAQKIDRG